MKINEFTRNFLIHFYNGCPVFRRYYRFNLWSEEFGEYNKIRYCEAYMSKYVYKFTHNLLVKYFNPSFVLILYSNPFFIKFIKSGFIRYIDFRFLRVFQENFFLCPDKSDKDIEIFVHKYFQENIRKKFEEDLFYCLIKLVVKSAPESFQGYLIKYFKCHYLDNQKKYNYFGLCSIFNNYFLIDELMLEYKRDGFYPVNNLFFSDNHSIFDALYNLLFEEKKGRRHKSFIAFRKDICIGLISYPFSQFINIRCNKFLNNVNKSSYSTFNYIFEFLFLCFLKLDILKGGVFFFFGPLYSYEFYLVKKHPILFEFAIEGLKDFNYKQYEICIPLHSNSVKKNI